MGAAEKFADAARQYESNPGAMHLRGMNMLFEGLKEKGSMIIVPSSALETMNSSDEMASANIVWYRGCPGSCCRYRVE